ncbi:MAG: flagellar motor protein, partial [Acidobacteriia bacterium]|nr:flagellar motor protein [Terriglobia bacterium]
GSIRDVSQVTAALIVFGGTLGAVLVTTPFPVFLQAVKGLREVFLERSNSAAETIETLTKFATQARRNGIVSLETDADNVADPFLRKALNLAVDGTDLNEIRSMMEIDIDVAEQAEEQKARVWEAAGGYSPTIGIIGAVLGLIQVMKHLDDISEVGHGIAVAFVATVYGVAVANILFLPFSHKLRARIQQARLLKELMLEGIIGIVEGLNPTLIRVKLSAFNQEGPQVAPTKGRASRSQVGMPQTVPAGD